MVVKILKDIYERKEKNEFMKVVKISKEKTKLLLNMISEDNFEYGLIFKLCYIYGRQISEVYNLHSSDVNFDVDKISFKINNEYVKYNIHDSVRDDLLEYCNGLDGYLFTDISLNFDNFISRLNYYLKKYDDYCGVHISPRDFKKLRGQHLITDGVSVSMVQVLYHGADITSTKRFLNYNGLLGINDVESLDMVFSDYTDV